MWGWGLGWCFGRGEGSWAEGEANNRRVDGDACEDSIMLMIAMCGIYTLR